MTVVKALQNSHKNAAEKRQCSAKLDVVKIKATGGEVGKDDTRETEKKKIFSGEPLCWK